MIPPDQDHYTPTMPSENDPASYPARVNDGLPQLGEHILADQYEVFGRREGSLGVVLFLRDLVDGKDVAAKTYRGLTTEDQLASDFRKEAEFWIELNHHPNVLRALSVETYQDRPYLLMEYVENGITLRHRLKIRISSTDAIQFAYQFALGMEAANKKSEVAHLDLKPENLLITPQGVLKVTDFGLASTVNAYQGRIPRPRHGSWPYAAPERFLGKPEDSRSDIYSFGVIFYEMLFGKLPYAGDLDHNSTKVDFHNFYRSGQMKNIARDIYYSGVSDIDRGPLSAILSTCLGASPSSRFASFKALREMMERAFQIAFQLKSRDDIEASDNEYSQAMSYYHLGRYEKALDLINRTLIKNPDDAFLWYAAGQVLIALGKRDEGVSALQNSLRLKSDLAEVRQLLDSLS